MYRVDLHTHPTSHKYYFGNRVLTRLDDEDKKNVERFIHWGLSRGLDAIGITDHHYLAAGLYGAEYAYKYNLPIQVLPGVELEPKQLGLMRSVHILAFNLARDIPKLLGVQATLAAIREQDGVAIMAHPVFCPDEFRHIAHLLDGVEVWNVLSAYGGIGHLQRRLWRQIDNAYPQLAQFENSDCHSPNRKFPMVYSRVDPAMFARLGGRLQPLATACGVS